MTEEGPPRSRSRSLLRVLLGPVLSFALLGWVLSRMELEVLRGALALASLPALLGATALLVARDAGAEVARWIACLRIAGHPLRYRDVVGIYAAGSAAKSLLPGKLGEAWRIWMLRDALGVPMRVGALARLGSIGALGLLILLALASTFGGWIAGGAWAGAAGALAVGAWRWGPEGLRVMAWTLPSLLCELGAYGLSWWAVMGQAAPPRAVLIAVLAAQAPVGLRGIGLREAALEASSRAGGSGGAALLVSAAELLALVCLAGLGALWSRRGGQSTALPRSR